MPIYMDRHYIEGATQHGLANAHAKDLEVQDEYNIKFLTYWFDEERWTGFCLVDAPDEESIRSAHDQAHGSVPHEIIQVDPVAVEAFLGRINDPVASEKAQEASEHVPVDSAFRTIMFTDLQGSTTMTTRLGDAQAMNLLRIHNALTRNALRTHNGREVKHTGDGFMVSFYTASDAVECAIAVQRAFSFYNEESPEAAMHVRIGLSAGEPVEEEGDLFGSTVQLAARLCAQAKPGRILAAQIVRDECQAEAFPFLDLGQVTPKGFDHPVQLYGVNWQRSG